MKTFYNKNGYIIFRNLLNKSKTQKLKNSFGKTIKIVHKHGVSTLYGHLHKLNVKKGMNVSEGQVIGKMGSTGRAVGAHLHYEIKVNGKSVNPYDFISVGRDLLSSSIIKK